MGRKKTDGKAVDVTVPGGSAVVKGDLYRIDNITGFAMDDIAVADTERSVALERSESIWICRVPAGVAATRGDYLKWTAAGGTTFQEGVTHLVNETTPAVKTAISVAQVETVRNSDGYAALKLCL